MKAGSSLIKSIGIAFSMFSKLPTPHFKWEEEDMKYMIVFFPLVGVVIGGVTYLWGMLCQALSIHKVCLSFIGAALPLLITGGIHADGYMDTADALNSYQEKKRKLEILKDAHIGAFAVIALTIYYMIYIGAYSEIEGKDAFLLLGGGFYLSRILSAVGVVSFPCAKKEGLVYLFSNRADKLKARIFLYLQLVLCGAYFLWVSPAAGGTALFAGGITLSYYYWKSRKEFGGITGDTAGYFTLLCEEAVIVVIAVFCIIGKL